MKRLILAGLLTAQIGVNANPKGAFDLNELLKVASSDQLNRQRKEMQKQLYDKMNDLLKLL